MEFLFSLIAVVLVGMLFGEIIFRIECYFKERKARKISPRNNPLQVYVGDKLVGEFYDTVESIEIDDGVALVDMNKKETE